MFKPSKIQLISIFLLSLNLVSLTCVAMKNEIKRKNSSINDVEQRKSQTYKMLEKSIVRVAIYKNTAYWVLNNVIYKARVDEDGNVIDSEAEQIDVFNLSEKEVNKLLAILDSISI